MNAAIKSIFTLLFIGCFATVTAQTECSQALIQAERAYYNGRFDEIQSLLSGCINEGFNKEQRTEAYRLIALGAIFSKNFVKADSALRRLLKSNPQYEFSSQDPPEFRSRFQKFKIYPLIEIGVNLGLMMPFFKVTEVYDSRVLSATTTYDGKVGAHAGISAAYYLNKRISVKAGYEIQAFSFTIEDANDLNIALLTENQRRTQWIAGLGYGFFWRKINLQLYGGVVYSTLRQAETSLIMTREGASAEKGFTFSNLDQRTVHELRPMVEFKVSFLQKNNWLINLGLRYEHGLTNLTNTDNRYSNLTNVAMFEWVEDDFTGSNIIVSLGLSKFLCYRMKLK